MDKQSISTGLIAGLAATLFFSISFSLLEYTIKSSIIFGVIAGISAGLLGYWSQIESRPEIPEKTNAEPVDSPKESKPPKPPKPPKTWPKTPRERSGVSILSWLSRSSPVSSRRYQKARKKY
ncbi:hypothetical protein [Okeania sp. SIO1I7]|uniref:hypothetical protein n=1 Tax=Okeania sp. SIO1I7 TaxID=2607772 RepID=UPI0013FA3B75|nr:hypothetical protein [Okeania sp. SIO1I7]NET29362.1 hypothetical protein [Okeania sp. SIO1I7]